MEREEDPFHRYSQGKAQGRVVQLFERAGCYHMGYKTEVGVS